MIVFDKNLKIFQTLPAQGWRALVLHPGVEEPLEHAVVAFVSYRDESLGRESASRLAGVLSTPGGWFFANGPIVVYLTPGEAATPDHESRLRRLHYEANEAGKAKAVKRG